VRLNWLLCLATLSVALLVGIGFAQSRSDKKAPSGNPSKTAGAHSDTERVKLAGSRVHQPGRQSSGRRERRHVPDKAVQRTRATLANMNRPGMASNDLGLTTSANGTNVHQELSSRSDQAARQTAFRQETMNSALPVRPATAVRIGSPSPANARHRGSNPAIVGGPMNATARNTSALSGSAVHRRP
jgi:hypothetical protein